ncbi:MAG: cytochrome c [Sulfurimonas sp.]|nr:cytochrome c [Sulfurimonas sp.]
MKKIFKSSVLLLATVLCSSNSYAGGHETDHKEMHIASGVKSLSPELRGLLLQEMNALQKGMMSIIPELASGNLHEVHKIAKKIQGSYILKQKLTKEQAKELHTKLPSSFIELDQSFHKDAGMLADVAEQKNAELANFYFSKMNNTCINCHSRFATHRFPAFKVDKKTIEHDHSNQTH